MFIKHIDLCNQYNNPVEVIGQTKGVPPGMRVIISSCFVVSSTLNLYQEMIGR
jgi:hypothetical protein